jgi:hypothetical protein
MGNKKLFISHASKDKPLVDRFVDLILDNGCNVDRNDIYYTSDLDMGIKPGKDFIADIKRNMTESSIIILMISPNFYNSVFCLGEVGATWMLDIDTFPIVVPEFKLREVKDILQVTQMGMLDDQDYLDRLHDAVIEKLGVARPKTGTWNQKCYQFLKELPKLISELPKPDKVNSEKYRELEETYQAAQEQIQMQVEEISKLKNLVAQLEAVKDKDEVTSIILDNSTEAEKLRILVNYANGALRYLPNIVQHYIYLRQISHLMEFSYDILERNSQFAQMDQARRDGYFKGDNSYEYALNDEDSSVKDAIQKIDNLERFIESVDPSSGFAQSFREEHGYNLGSCLSTERFWKDYLK